MSDEAEATVTLGAAKEAQTAHSAFVAVIGDFKANRFYSTVAPDCIASTHLKNIFVLTQSSMCMVSFPSFPSRSIVQRA